MGHGPSILLHILRRACNAALLHRPARLLKVGRGDIAHLLGIGAMARIGDDIGVKAVPRRHAVEIPKHLRVQLIVVHAHVRIGVVLLKAQVLVYAAPAVYAGTGRMEGVYPIALALKEVRKTQREGVGGVAAVGHTHRRGHQPGLGYYLRVEGPGREEQRGVEIGELHTLVHKPTEIWHILRPRHPGVYALKHYQHQVLAPKAPAELIGRGQYPALENLRKLLRAAGVRAYTEGDGEVTGSILVKAGELHTAVGICEAPVYQRVLVHGRVPGHHIALLWHKPLVGKAQPQKAEGYQGQRAATPYPEPPPGCLGLLRQHHGRRHHQQEHEHKKVHLLRQPEVGPAEEFGPVSGEVHVRKAEKMAEDVVHHAVQHH